MTGRGVVGRGMTGRGVVDGGVTQGRGARLILRHSACESRGVAGFALSSHTRVSQHAKDPAQLPDKAQPRQVCPDTIRYRDNTGWAAGRGGRYAGLPVLVAPRTGCGSEHGVAVVD
ncbi:MAG: hypothetical protein AMXMBFR61_01000 [Fimbriimonadales bacterium]